jgi:hypothetical protein
LLLIGSRRPWMIRQGWLAYLSMSSAAIGIMGTISETPVSPLCLLSQSSPFIPTFIILSSVRL